MKSKKYARIIMGCCLMILIGCHNKNLETPIEPTVILEKTNPYPEILKLDDDIYSFQPLLEEIARYIAKNRHLITDNLANKMLAAPVMLSELDPAKKFPASVIESDGTPYEIGVELFINSTLNGKPLRVAIDPDRFYSQKPSFPVFVFDRSKKVIRVEDIYINSSDDMVPYPLAFVTLEDRTEISWEEIRKNSKIYKEYGLVGNSREHPQKQFGKSSRVQSVTSSVIDYLAITNVRLFVELDGATKEEFEIYIREGSNFNDPVNRTTDHLFNGKWHEDAARNSRFYVDVNNKNTTYSFSPSIALWPLSNSTPTALAMIEDDRTSGKHKQPSSSSPITVTFLEEYRRSTQAVYYNVDRKMNIFEGDMAMRMISIKKACSATGQLTIHLPNQIWQ